MASLQSFSPMEACVDQTLANRERIPGQAVEGRQFSFLKDALQSIANEVNTAILWTCEAITVAAILAALARLFYVQSGTELLAVCMVLGFLTVSACGGGYVITLKEGPSLGHSSNSTV